MGQKGQKGQKGQEGQEGQEGQSKGDWLEPCSSVDMSYRHENLVAWQRADELCVEVYKLTSERFPKTERYGLTSQLRRASYSVAANIVEGYAFESDRTKLRHLRIAAASLAELAYGMHLATRLRYLPAKDADGMMRSLRQTGAPLHGLIREVAKKATSHRSGS